MCVAGLAALLSSCGKTQKDSVWNIYDYRHPVPASSVPAASPERRYYIRDNDSFYTPPKGFNCIQDNNIFCE